MRINPYNPYTILPVYRAPGIYTTLTHMYSGIRAHTIVLCDVFEFILRSLQVKISTKLTFMLYIPGSLSVFILQQTK